MPRKTPFTFHLPNISIEHIDKIFGFVFLSNVQDTTIPQNSTKITELENKNVLFQDEVRNNLNGKISQIQLQNKNYKCFWCRHYSDEIMIGCPIRIQPQIMSKTYTSVINNNTYTIQQRSRGSVETYDADGAFCSFECCYAFIKDNKHNPMYDYSEILLKKIFGQHYPSSVLHRAPHWRLLQEYGGNMTIDGFRKSFQSITYNFENILWNSACYLFRERYHL
jgi:hypothetical protein